MKAIPMRITLLCVLITILLSACTPGNAVDPTPLPSATLPATATPSPIPTATPEPTPTPTPLPLDGKQTQYFIDATINYYNRYISVISRSVYTNKTEIALEDILFIVYPTIFQSYVHRSVKNNTTNENYDYYWDGHRMIIPLTTPLAPGEKIEIVHEYDLIMPDRVGVFSQSARQLNLSYWYPFIPPYDEENGWVAHPPEISMGDFIGEFLVFEASDFDVTIQFTDRRENFKIAAGALPEENDGVIRFKLDLARTFVISISDAYIMVEREVNGIKVHSYAFTEHLSVAEVVADVAVDAISYFSEIFGPYNRDVITISEFNADIGMEFDGIIFLSFAFYNLFPGTPKSNIHIYTAHEIAHQWFFSIVGNDQALEPWLDESFATYSELLFYEKFYPDHVTWWWENYIDFHNPSGFIDITIYFGGSLSEYRNIVYRNGVRFLHDLRQFLGDEVFFAFLYDYVQTHRYEIATGQDFYRTLRNHTDADLTPIFEEYFSSSPGNP